MGELTHTQEKGKHNLIPELFELGTTCSLLKRPVWRFIIVPLTRRDVFMCCCVEFLVSCGCVKALHRGFPGSDVRTCEISLHMG